MPFTIDEAASILETKEIEWLGKTCKITAVPVATIAQIRANWPAPIAPPGASQTRDYQSPVYQARLIADQQEMRILELAAAIDLAPVFGYSVQTGPLSVAKTPRSMAMSEVLSLPESEMGAATEEWCKAAMKALGGLPEEKLKPLSDAYEELCAADVSAGARGN